MNNPKLHVPRFESGSYSERASFFFDDAREWDIPPESEEAPSRYSTRTVTWAHYPYRYWLEQSAEQQPHLFKKPTLNHRMFEVVLMSATRTLDGLQELERWYVVKSHAAPEQLFHMQQLVDTPEQEKATGEMNKNFDFALDNGLYVPNTEDLTKLDTILEQGRMDGFDIMRREA